MGKKKTQRQQDFQKVKLKVGRKVLKSQNETKITVKAKQIVIKEQLKAKNHLREATTIRKRLTVPELLVHLAHYNPSMRYEGISGLGELLSRDLESVLANLSALLERLSPIFVDKDGNVRRGCRNLLKKLFPLVSVERMEPFFGLPIAHLYCAMTHIDEDVRRDSLEIVDVCLRHYPSLVVRDAGTFLDHFLLQISTKKGVGATSSSTLLVSPTNRISTVKWRTEVFKRLVKVFQALDEEDGEAEKKNGEESKEETIAAASLDSLETTASVVDIVTFSSFDLRDCFQRSRQRPAGVSSNASSSGTGLDCAALQEFGETLIPLLIDSWVEASPAADHNLGRGQNKSVSMDVFDLFATTASLLKLLLKISSRLHLDTEQSLRSTFSRKFLPDLAKRFMPFFPLQAPQIRKKESHSFSDAGAAASSAPFVNLVICDVLTFDSRVLLKNHPPVWLQTVFDHLDRFFSSSNLMRAADDELTLALGIVRRCLKSPAFAAKYLRPIFGRGTSVFFKLSPEPQLLFLDFFTEFLTEFSALLSHEDSFLGDKAVRTWLENLPAFLRDLLIKMAASNNNNGEDSLVLHSEKSQPPASSSSNVVEIISLRIFRLFALASRMNFGAFFPLRHFLSHVLTRDAFLSLGSDAQRRAVVTLVGHADLDDDGLFVLLADFLSSDYHRLHGLLWETIIFRWTEKRREQRDDGRLVALILATVAAGRPSKQPFTDARESIEKRLGVYFVRVGEDGSWLELKDYLTLIRKDPSYSGGKIESALVFLETLYR